MSKIELICRSYVCLMIYDKKTGVVTWQNQSAPCGSLGSQALPRKKVTWHHENEVYGAKRGHMANKENETRGVTKRSLGH